MITIKKIGRQVHFIPARKGQVRNGEGSFIRLTDGTILFGYTEFSGESREDEGIARICAIFSCDNGESWSDKQVLFETPENAINIMSLSLLSMQNGDIGAFYIQKATDGCTKIMLTRSANDGKTWSEPVNCIEELEAPDYYVLNNDRVIRLKNGRILLPLARHTIYCPEDVFMPGELCFFYSDDDGKTFHKTNQELKCPFPNDPNGFQEPGLFELEDGKIWCYIRTGLGFQFQCFSEDSGESWSTPEPNTFFSSPCSPMHVRACGDFTVAIFNPVPEHILRDDEAEFWGRTPYAMAVSLDKGKTFERKNLYYIEDDLNNGYCYPAILAGDDHFFVAYYHSNNTDCCLNSTKIIKIMYDESGGLK